MKRDNQSCDYVAEIIAKNLDTTLWFMQHQEVDQSGTNEKRGDFFVLVDGTIYPCYLVGEHDLRYFIDRSVYYHTEGKYWVDSKTHKNVYQWAPDGL